MKYYLSLFVLTLLSCGSEKEFPEVKKLSDYKQTDFIYTPEQSLPKSKNVIYSPTILMAWQQLKAVAGDTISIAGDFDLLRQINKSEAHKNTLGKEEFRTEVYFAPNEDIPGKITVRAEFDKSLPFHTDLIPYENKLRFRNAPVQAFGCKGTDGSSHAIRIVFYLDDNNFAVALPVESDGDEMIVCMVGDKPQDIASLVAEVEKRKHYKLNRKDIQDVFWTYEFLEDDELIVPKLNFNIETAVGSIEGNSIKVKQVEYIIEKVYQRTAFILDEKGAKIESEAEMTTVSENPVGVVKPNPKKMHFDKPFLIYAKRFDSPNPYFAAWIENAELMVKE